MIVIQKLKGLEIIVTNVQEQLACSQMFHLWHVLRIAKEKVIATLKLTVIIKLFSRKSFYKIIFNWNYFKQTVTWSKIVKFYLAAHYQKHVKFAREICATTSKFFQKIDWHVTNVLALVASLHPLPVFAKHI